MRDAVGGSQTRRRVARFLALWALAGFAPTAAAAQGLPQDSFGWWNDRIVLGGDVSVSTSKVDRGWFNDADYGKNVLRLATGGLSTSAALGSKLTVLGEFRFENTLRPRVLSLFARVHPWARRAVDIQIGRVPPVFGTFGRRRYGIDNPLIGYPLAYQYLTSLRAEASPASADALLAMRGSGWLVRYPASIGSPTPASGLPLASALEWDTGVEVHVGGRPVDAAFAVTRGSLSEPRVHENNGGKQIAARLGFRPTPVVSAGVSAASGAYLDRRVGEALGADRSSYVQRALGADIELSRDHWLLRGELLSSRWDVPAVAEPRLASPLRALAVSVEGRYRVAPSWYLASRAEHIGFSPVAGTLYAGAPTPWDAPVTRLEIGGGYYVRSNVVAKLVFQQNWRDLLPVRRSQGQFAAQLAYWF
ncbi:MAG: hypothetical protein U0Q12_15780 [Vicinamibacterales bacterium]